MTEKHVLIGCKHATLGNQAFERFMIPFTYFAYWLHSRHLNHLISEILGQRNTWFEVSAYLTKTSTNLKTFKLWCESLLNARRTSNVWLPSMSCLRPIRKCFSVVRSRGRETSDNDYSLDCRIILLKPLHGDANFLL